MAFAEAATRFIFRDVTTSSDNQGFFTRRWAEAGAVQTNGAGFRERSFSEVKAPGTYRIIAVGDSFTYGNGIRNDERYTEILQKGLPNNFEVLNFGTAGANTPQHLQTVANVVLPLKPDFVILQWYVNDVEGHDATGRPTYHSLLPFSGLHGWLIDESAFYTVANMQWAKWQVALGMDADLCGLPSPTDERSRTDRMPRQDRATLVGVDRGLPPARRVDRHGAVSRYRRADRCELSVRLPARSRARDLQRAGHYVCGFAGGFCRD